MWVVLIVKVNLVRRNMIYWILDKLSFYVFKLFLLLGFLRLILLLMDIF